MGDKLSALTWERVVKETGGPDTVWAMRMRKALDDAGDPLHREHAADNAARQRVFESEAAAINRLYQEKTKAVVGGAKTTSDDKIREKLRAEIESARKKSGPRSLTEWALAKRVQIEKVAKAQERAIPRAVARARERDHQLTIERTRHLEQTREHGRSL